MFPAVAGASGIALAELEETWVANWRRECTRIRTVADLLPWREAFRAALPCMCQSFAMTWPHIS